jgi:hypothetical protein
MLAALAPPPAPPEPFSEEPPAPPTAVAALTPANKVILGEVTFVVAVAVPPAAPVPDPVLPPAPPFAVLTLKASPALVKVVKATPRATNSG